MERNARQRSDIQSILLEHLSEAASEAFISERQDLVNKEVYASWTGPAERAANEVELKAAQIVTRILNHERRHLFGSRPGETIPDSASAEMGGRYLTNKERIEESRILQMAKRMPKACHLHVHFNTEIPIEDLLQKARDLPETMFVRSTKTLTTPNDYDECEIIFDVLPSNTLTRDIFSEHTPSDKRTENGPSWMRWVDFRTKFPHFMNFEKERHGVLDDAETWAIEKIVFSSRSTRDVRDTVNGYVSIGILCCCFTNTNIGPGLASTNAPEP